MRASVGKRYFNLTYERAKGEFARKKITSAAKKGRPIAAMKNESIVAENQSRLESSGNYKMSHKNDISNVITR